ncbi:MAG: hypothetical protein V2A54_13240 [Bacteroidota bacterium]
MKIFIIESPNPNDLFEGRNEKSSLEHICRMYGHKTSSLTTYSKADLEKIVNYLSIIKLEENEHLCIHFSSHGNNSGIQIGGDFINWKEFTKILIPILTELSVGNQTIISISACHAKEQLITTIINEAVRKYGSSIAPPIYFFVFNESRIKWNDALLCWSILYHQLGKLSKFSKENIQSIVKRISNADFGEILYFRWDSSKLKYLKFRPKIS